MRTLLVSLSSLLLLTCGGGVGPVVALPEETPPVTLESRLGAADVPVMKLMAGESRGTVEVRRPAEGPEYTSIALRATGGTLGAHLAVCDKQRVLKLDQLEVKLADVVLFDSGVELTGLHFHMAAVDLAPVQWNNGRTALSAQLTVTLTVSGSWRGPGGAVGPFESQVFKNVPLELTLTLDGSKRLVATFGSKGDQAPTWSWAGLLETGAAKFDGLAAEGEDTPYLL